MDFEPTFLYIKQHAITGKCYFGKTTKKDPTKYLGSGTYWTPHVKKHGKEHVETLWFKLFTDQAECTRVALLFSEQQDIVKSDLWLNLIPEDGLSGFPNGERSPEIRAKISDKNKNRFCSEETRAKISNARTGIKKSVETRAKMSKPKSVETRTKMSAAQKGRIISAEHRAKISEANQNPSAETRAKMSIGQKNRQEKTTKEKSNEVPSNP